MNDQINLNIHCEAPDLGNGAADDLKGSLTGVINNELVFNIFK